jgi:16S rRNA processing protein RimM
MNEFLAVARVVRPHGRKGEVLAEILTDFPERFQKSRAVFLEKSAFRPEPALVEKASIHKGRFILKFAGIDSIEQASSLRGLHVLIPGEQRAPLPPHRYYLWELQGCRVVRQRSGGLAPVEIGIVTEVETGTRGVDLLHVALLGARQKEALIPLVQSICKTIDVEAKFITIDPPEDLLELNA